MPTMLAPKDIREARTFDFEVLTPIHIGTREGALKATEFLWDGGKVHILDEDRFAVWLKERNLIDSFVEEAKAGRLNLKAFFQRSACKGWREDLPCMTRLSIPGGIDGQQEFRPMIRDAVGRVYLPGTTIKGVLRTAVLYAWMKQQATRRRLAESKVQAFDGKNKKFFSAEWLQKAALQSTPLPGARSGPNEDMLRCLTVRDAYPVQSIETRVIKLQFLSKKRDGGLYWSNQKDANGRPKQGKLESWVEAVTAGRFRVEMSWDSQLWKVFVGSQPEALPINGLDSLISAANAVSEDVARFEREHYKGPAGEEVPAAEALHRWYTSLPDHTFRIGFGSGLLSTTIGLQLSLAARQRVRDQCAPRNGVRPGDPAPKSRRVWVKPDGSALPLGWGRLVEPQGEPVAAAFAHLEARAGIAHMFEGVSSRRPTDDQQNHESKGAHPPREETWTGCILTHNKGGGGILRVQNPEGMKAETCGSAVEAILNKLSDDQRRQLAKKGQLANVPVVVVVEGNSRRLKGLA